MKKCVAAISSLILLCCCSSRSAAGETSDSSGCESADAPSQVMAFDPDSAFALVQAQCDFGPRVPGSEAHALCGDMVQARLRALADTVIEQRATLRAFDSTPLPMRNILARFNPEADSRILLLAHWDTRPWADNDPDEANHRTPVTGANDGASGVAVLLEVARGLREADSRLGVDILLVDCEDYGSQGDDSSWALGARYFASHLPEPGYSPKAAILLDMVGGEGTVFPREYFSQQAAPWLLDALWASARATGHGNLFPQVQGGAITDDHVCLIEAGIPAVDVIGADPASGGFPKTWHTLSDTPAAISPQTLRAVGETLMHFLSAQ